MGPMADVCDVMTTCGELCSPEKQLLRLTRGLQASTTPGSFLRTPRLLQVAAKKGEGPAKGEDARTGTTGTLVQYEYQVLYRYARVDGSVLGGVQYVHTGTYLGTCMYRTPVVPGRLQVPIEPRRSRETSRESPVFFCG